MFYIYIYIYILYLFVYIYTYVFIFIHIYAYLYILKHIFTLHIIENNFKFMVGILSEKSARFAYHADCYKSIFITAEIEPFPQDLAINLVEFNPMTFDEAEVAIEM